MTRHRNLAVEGQLTVDIGARQAQVYATGTAIAVEFPSLLFALRTLKDLRRIWSTSQMLRMSQLLTHAGLTLRIGTPRMSLLTTGRDGDSWLPRLVGMITGPGRKH